MVCFNIGSWLSVSILPPGKDDQWRLQIATPSSIGKPSWPLRNRYRTWGGAPIYTFTTVYWIFPQGLLRIEFLNLGRMAQVRKERQISGPLVFCGCHSPPRKRCLVVTGIADGVTGSTTRCSHFALKSRWIICWRISESLILRHPYSYQGLSFCC